MLTLGEVKNFLRIDHEDDDVFLVMLIEASEEYIYNATGKTYEGNKLAKILKLTLISDWYENRTINVENRKSKIRPVIESILTQLRYKEDDGEV